MTKLASFSNFTLFGAFGALLAGCPVWGPGMSGPIGDASVDRPDVAPLPSTCSTSAECPSGQYCSPSSNTCTPSPSGCTSTSQCESGYYCDARSTCVPGCSSTADCAFLGAGLVCNETTRRCEAGGNCSTGAMRCAEGTTCVDGRCRSPASVCQFNFQCAAGQSCVDGRCVSGCSASLPCSGGQVCNTTTNRCENPPTTGCSACSEGQVCSGGSCVSACTTDRQCPSGQFCDQGGCRVDDRRPAPFCTPPSTGCASGSLCVDGVCRISCPAGMATECMMRDVNFNQCDSARICRYANETAPQCARTADCADGRSCIDARCL